jgi:hypothetical protein
VTFTVNANANSLAVGTYGPTAITFTNSDTGQGTQTRTATLTVNPLPLQVTPATNIAASGTQGGPFSPSSFSYTLSVASGSVNYSISNVPNWLTPSSTSGTASSSGTTVTFTVNANATGLTPNTYVNSINFNNTTNGQGNTTRVATLTVNPPPLLQVTPATNTLRERRVAHSHRRRSATRSAPRVAVLTTRYPASRTGSPCLRPRAPHLLLEPP